MLPNLDKRVRLGGEGFKYHYKVFKFKIDMNVGLSFFIMRLHPFDMLNGTVQVDMISVILGQFQLPVRFHIPNKTSVTGSIIQALQLKGGVSILNKPLGLSL